MVLLGRIYHRGKEGAPAGKGPFGPMEGRKKSRSVKGSCPAGCDVGKKGNLGNLRGNPPPTKGREGGRGPAYSYISPGEEEGTVALLGPGGGENSPKGSKKGTPFGTERREKKPQFAVPCREGIRSQLRHRRRTP